MQQDPRHDVLRMAAHLPSAGLYMMSDAVNYREMLYRSKNNQYSNEDLPALYIKIVSSNLNFRMIETTPVLSFSESFKPVDCTPRFDKEINIKDMNWFQPSAINADKLIVDKDDVNKLMDIILKSQSIKQAEIRKKEWTKKQLEEMGAEPNYKVHSQIITLCG